MSVDDKENNARFIELKAQGRLPSIKGVALSILEATSNEEVSLGRIAQIITPDPALTARLIKISNSALYPGSRPVASLQDAIQKLGFGQVRHIALSFALVSENKEGSCASFDYPGFWARSILRGALMRQACLMLKLGSPEEMFTLGLLAKIGELALATAYPEKYAMLLDAGVEGKALRAKEREVFGMDAPSLSAALMDDWKLPQPFSAAAMLEAQFNETAPNRIKGLFALICGAEIVSKGWLDRQELEQQKRLEELTQSSLDMLQSLVDASALGATIGSEQAYELNKAAFEEALSWLESLSILPKLKSRRLRIGGARGFPSSNMGGSLEPKRPLTEEIIDPGVNSESIKALIGTMDSGALKTIAQALSMRSGQIMALRTKDQLFDELLEFGPHILMLDFDPTPGFAALLESIKETEFGKNLLVIALAKAEQENKLLPLLSNGIDDYLIRPFSLAQASAKIATAEKIAGISRSMRESREAIKRYALELEAANKKLLHTSIMDGLTGLPNRMLFNDRLKEAINATKKNGEAFAMLMIDLDNFKNINDSFGHPVGDDMLREMSQRLRPMIKAGDSLARMGGDEFTVILRNTDAAGAEVFAKKLIERISQPVVIHGRETRMLASIGIALSPNHGDEPAILTKHSDLALYKAKESGKANWCFYSNEMSDAASKRFSIESALNQALDNKEFEIYFQPRIDLSLGRVAGAEALLRWRNPEMGMIPPDVFIPIAEETGAIEVIGDWVLRESLKIAKPWLKVNQAFHVAVNLSSRQFKSRDLAKSIANALQQEGFPARNLELEVTESAAMEDIFFAARVLEEVKKIGLSVSLDDFGTGYSSLAYLKKLPIDILKIDKSFILNALIDKDDCAIAKMIAALAKTMGKGLVAEGIETAAHAAFANELGSRYGQGYLYARPMPAKDIEAILSKVW